MFFKYKNKTIVLLAVTLLCSCSPALYKPEQQHVSGDVTLEQLVQGRTNYVKKCGSCHSLYLPQTYNTSVWKHNLDEMQERAKISENEKQLILIYLSHYPKKS